MLLHVKILAAAFIWISHGCVLGITWNATIQVSSPGAPCSQGRVHQGLPCCYYTVALSSLRDKSGESSLVFGCWMLPLPPLFHNILLIKQLCLTASETIQWYLTEEECCWSPSVCNVNVRWVLKVWWDAGGWNTSIMRKILMTLSAVILLLKICVSPP